MKNYFKSYLIALMCMSTIAKAQVPQLSSYPSATAVIFLDFDGHTTEGTSWNYNGPIYSEPATLSNTQITEIFNRVAEDYRPFNINITTDSVKFLNAPATQKMRIVLSSSSAWYGSAGGVAFLNSFTWGDNTPCFVFTSLLNNNAKNISEAASHEAGHTLGLRHQANYDANCNKISDYHYGVGSGEIGWAPIMGVGYYKNFTLWHNGPNSINCNNYQSDLEIITSELNGFGFRPDDYDNTAANATSVNFSANIFTLNGIIERSGDQDMIKFEQPATGSFKLNAIPYNVGAGNAGSDLDMQVTLFDNNETVLGAYNPGAILSSVIDTVLNAGTYYLRVEGRGNLYAPQYASLGSYALQGIFNNGTPLPLRKLELKGALQQDKHVLSWVIDADEKTEKLIIETSTDGINFKPLIQTANNTSAYTYKPYAASTIFYRLNVTFDNGRQYYSNVIGIRQGGTDKPRLVNNIIYNKNLYINSPGNFEYKIFDLNGRMLNKGRLTTGMITIKAPLLSKGMYVIRFTNDEEQWTEKFVSH